MALYDVDNSGDISFEEFKQLAQDKVILEGQLKQYEDFFKAADTSGDGRLSQAELWEVFQKLQIDIPYDDMVAKFAQFDKDGSGGIDFSEFLALMRTNIIEFERVINYLKLQPSSTQSAQHAPVDPQLFEVSEQLKVSLVSSVAELEAVVAHWSRSHVVVLCASMSWCRKCKSMDRPMERLAAAYSNVKFVKFHGNASEEMKALLKDKLKARAVPSFFIYTSEGLQASFSGGNKVRLETALRAAMAQGALPTSPVYEGVPLQAAT